MRAIRVGCALALVSMLTACGSAEYVVESPQVDSATGKPKILQLVKADAPGGDSFVTVVYYGANIAPTVSAGGDSTALVNAMASAGQDALQVVVKALLAK
jgi:hypothetical protein